MKTLYKVPEIYKDIKCFSMSRFVDTVYKLFGKMMAK